MHWLSRHLSGVAAEGLVVDPIHGNPIIVAALSSASMSAPSVLEQFVDQSFLRCGGLMPQPCCHTRLYSVAVSDLVTLWSHSRSSA